MRTRANIGVGGSDQGGGNCLQRKRFQNVLSHGI